MDVNSEEAAEWSNLMRRNSALEQALKDIVSDVLEYERVNNLAPNPGRTFCWDSVARAHAILNCHDRPAMSNPTDAASFIWCDIDGRGKRWRLAIHRPMDDDGDDGLYFPVDDFHDYAENFEDCPVSPVSVPPPIRPVPMTADEAAEQMDNGRNTGGKSYR